MTGVETADGSLYMIERERSADAPAARVVDVTLVDAARRGDREAFERLYAAYAPMVHGVLLARAPCDDVRDLVQDVFLTAFTKLMTLRDTQAFPAWLAMIARNRALDHHRSRRETEELSEETIAPDDSRTRVSEIIAIIRSLPEAYRETLVLRLVEGMTGPEIAVRTGMRPESVRVNLHRGMKMLRGKMKTGGLP